MERGQEVGRRQKKGKREKGKIEKKEEGREKRVYFMEVSSNPINYILQHPVNACALYLSNQSNFRNYVIYSKFCENQVV